MKVGDLVIMPNAKDNTLRPHIGVGLIVDDRPIKNRIGVMWAGETCIDFEPLVWLEVVNESR
jgi:hypothetical protein